VTPMHNGEFHRSLAALYAEQDRMLEEHRERMADREAQASPPVSGNGDAGLIFKDYAGNAQASAATAEPAPSFFDEGFSERQSDALALVIAELQRQWQEDIDNLQSRLANMIARFAFPGERAEETNYALKNQLARMEGRIRQRELETAKFERQVADLAGESIEIKALIGNVLKKLDAPKTRKRR